MGLLLFEGETAVAFSEHMRRKRIFGFGSRLRDARVLYAFLLRSQLFVALRVREEGDTHLLAEWEIALHTM